MAGNYAEQGEAQARATERAGRRAAQRRRLRRQRLLAAGAFVLLVAATAGAVAGLRYEGATTEIPGFDTREHPCELARTEVLGSWGTADLAAAMRADARATRG
jgi:L-amino acid N-acyltransferase YncA